MPNFQGISSWQVTNQAAGVTNGGMEFAATSDNKDVYVTYNDPNVQDSDANKVSIKIIDKGNQASTVALVSRKFPTRAVRIDSDGDVVTQNGIMGNQEYFTMEIVRQYNNGDFDVRLRSHSNNKYLSFQPRKNGNSHYPLSAYDDDDAGGSDRQLLRLKPMKKGKSQVVWMRKLSHHLLGLSEKKRNMPQN